MRVRRPTPRRRAHWMRAGKGRVEPRVLVVREEDASPAVLECFEEITATLGFPLVSVIFRAFAKYPRFLRLAWDFLKPNVLTQDFFDKAEVIRRHATSAVHRELGVADYRASLRLRGSSDDAVKRLRAVVDFFLYCDSFLLLIASALQSSLAGRPLRGKSWAHLLPHHTNPTRLQEVKLVEFDEAPAGVQQIYRELMAAHGLGFVPSDYRALAVTPEFLSVAWGEWREKIGTATFRASARELDELALALAVDLPFGFALSPQTLRRAGFTATQLSDILATVDLFQGLLPALIINMAAFKTGLEGGRRPG